MQTAQQLLAHAFRLLSPPFTLLCGRVGRFVQEECGREVYLEEKACPETGLSSSCLGRDSGKILRSLTAGLISTHKPTPTRPPSMPPLTMSAFCCTCTVGLRDHASFPSRRQGTSQRDEGVRSLGCPCLSVRALVRGGGGKMANSDGHERVNAAILGCTSVLFRRGCSPPSSFWNFRPCFPSDRFVCCFVNIQ